MGDIRGIRINDTSYGIEDTVAREGGGGGGRTYIQIVSFSVVPNQAEKGGTVTSVTLSYTLNKAAASAKLDGQAVTLPGVSGTITLSGISVTGSHAYELQVTDEYGSQDSKSASLTFLNSAYWGAAAEPQAITSAFVRGLGGSALVNGRGRAFTATAGAGQYIWFALPSRFGACTFTVGGFAGGFTEICTLSHTNASGYTENYRVYRSDNAALGETNVIVS